MSRQIGAYWIRPKKDLGEGKWRIGEWTIATWMDEEWKVIETGHILKDIDLIEIGEPIEIKIRIDDAIIPTNETKFIGNLRFCDVGDDRIYTYQGLICKKCNVVIGTGISLVPKDAKFQCPGCLTVLIE